MKRKSLAGLALLMTALCLSASAEIRYVDNHDQEKETPERLNLRSTASTSSQLLGSYYTGTAVEVSEEEAQDGFVKVEVGGLTGYMSENYLVSEADYKAAYGDEAKGRAAEISLTGLWIAEEPLLDAPRSTASRLAGLTDRTEVRALGLSNGYAYITAPTEDGEATGYVRLLTLAETGDAKAAVIIGDETTDGVELRTQPNAKSESVMTVQNGATGIVLFGRSGSWVHVRIGLASGWVANASENLVSLKGAPRSSVPFYPPLMQTAAETLLYRVPGDKAQAYMTLDNGMKVEVLGMKDSYAYVRTYEGGAGAYESGDFGYVEASSLTATDSAMNTVAVAQADDGDMPVLLYTTPDKSGRLIGALVPGAQVRMQSYTQTDYVQLALGDMTVYAQKKNIRLITTGNTAASDRIPQRAVVRNAAKLLTEPAADAADCGTVEEGSRVYMLAKCGDWAFVNAGGSSTLNPADSKEDKLGFVQVSCLSAPAGTTHLVAAVTTDKVNMREKADKGSDIVEKARLAEVLRVADYGSTWSCVVKENGTRGYIMTKYLQFQ